MKRRLYPVLLALVLLLSLTACGGGSAESAPMASGAMADMKTDYSTSDMVVSETEMEAPAEEYGGANYSDGSGGTMAETERKMIRTAELQMETTEFDKAVEGLNALTEQMGGYFENSSIGTRSRNYRWAEYTVRIPAEHYNGFLNQAGELCHEIWRDARQEDVSEAYYDTAGRLKTQQIKLERLQELLSKAELMEDIITIESAISETEWNIENLSGTLRHYDGKVDYATVYITMNEVYKLSNVEEVPDSFGSRLGAAFEDGILDFMDSMEDLAVSFAYSWMWWLLGAAVIVLIWKKKAIRLPKIRIGRRKKKDDDQE